MYRQYFVVGPTLFASMEKKLTFDNARGAFGFWKHTARLHAAALEDGLQDPGYTELKAVILHDYASWTLTAALLATVGFAGMFVHVTPVTTESYPIATYISRHVYTISMALASMLSLACVNDFVSMGNYYNMVPAPYVLEAQSHLTKNAGLIRAPLTEKLQACGLAYSSNLFYQSVAFLCTGITNLIFLSQGPEFCLVPAVVFVIMWFQMKEYNEATHWHSSLLPVLADQKDPML